MATKVLTCDCVNAQQDAIHGPQRRVANRTGKSDPVVFRCTVCSKEHTAGGGVSKGKKK
jgi:hypothetical protein